MKLYVLGCMGPYPEKDRALSSYLVETKEAKVLLDCGSGALAQLQKYIEINQLDGLILSHLHGDHMSDVLSLIYYCASHNFRLNVYLPNEDSLEYRLIANFPLFNIIHISDGKTIKIKDQEITFIEMVHPRQTFGAKITDGSVTLSYTGDTVINPNLDILTKNADVVLADCAYPSEFHTPQTPHMSLYQGAKYAENKPFKLLVTHFKPECDISEEVNQLGLHCVKQGDIYTIKHNGFTKN
ncbi:MAG TPA: MBL fold metallo-hydrolase [Clostridia bacterium]